jgi:ABC-type antimicrobial peptide transport system permease subunit
MDPDLAITEVRSMEEVLADSMSRTTFTMTLLLLAAVIALFLGSIGIYGVVSYIVTQRTAEIGVRMALGAEPSTIRAMALFQGVRLAGAGVAIGLMAAVGMGRVIESLLFGVSPLDPLTLVGGSVTFLAVAALATLVPAQRAAWISPAESLREG